MPAQLRKIGNMKQALFKTTKFWILLGITLFSYLNTVAQDVQFTVDAPSRVEHGGQFRLTYSINQEGDFKGPEVTNFQLLGGPSVSSSTSMQIINGRTNSSTTKSYTYYLKADKIGKFKLPVASVNINGKNYKSAALAIEVVKSASPQNNSGQAAVSNTEFKPEGVVFVRSLVNKRNIYVGEPIVVTHKLYSKEQIANITDFKEPSYTNFWKENIDIGELKLTREVLDGQSYNVVILQKNILFPQKSGNLSIGEFKLDAVVKIVKKRKARDHFEQMMYGNIVQYYAHEEVSIKSPIVKIKAKDLPLNRPQNFNGVVGSFKLKAEVDKTELKANDAFNLKIKISGKGNVDLLEAPYFNFPPDFEVYDPKISKSSKSSTSGVSGSKTYEYLIIPRNEGDFVIPSFSFCYFDPQSERYESCSSPEFKIHVSKGEGEVVSGTRNVNVNRDEVKYVGSDIRHIMFECDEQIEIGDHSFNSLQHILWLSLSPLFALTLIVFIKKREQKRGNTSLMRLKKATKMAQKRLKTAHQFLQSSDKTKFYEETSKALWGYLSDKFNISLSVLSMELIQEKLSEKSVEKEYIDEISRIIEHCEYARYAPAGEQHEMAELYDSAIKIISKIEKSLK